MPTARNDPSDDSPTGAPVGATALLGRYQIHRVLGRGAFGEVVEVHDSVSGSDYALKLIPPELVRNDRQMQVVRANFALVSQLTHPHIATTRSLEVASSGEAYVIMDLVRGVDLDRWLAERRDAAAPAAEPSPVPIEIVLGIAEQVAAALDYAHGQPVGSAVDGKSQAYGVLHRDLKPANVMVDANRLYRTTPARAPGAGAAVPGVPYVRLVDFGLAAEVQASMLSLSVLGQNQIAGTPFYMAPEQWEGRTLTRGVDQWALAVMIYEMASGRRPFNAPSHGAIMTLVREANPEQPLELSASQWRVLKQSLQADRKLRHPSCLALVKALANADRRTAGSVLATAPGLPDEFAAERALRHGTTSIGRLTAIGLVLIALVAACVVALNRQPAAAAPAARVKSAAARSAPPSPAEPSPASDQDELETMNAETARLNEERERLNREVSAHNDRIARRTADETRLAQEAKVSSASPSPRGPAPSAPIITR